ncbi:uncharacterized protein LOC142825267 [Pelodiscus sinensis]|uniref:uncharacterized protein LOC142825267 n=1 Tax=Pelodiscus sinensis TaxID=13735 RepID=UPI003F6CD5E7
MIPELYESLSKSALKDLCLGRGIAFRKRASKLDLVVLLLTRDVNERDQKRAREAAERRQKADEEIAKRKQEMDRELEMRKAEHAERMAEHAKKMALAKEENARLDLQLKRLKEQERLYPPEGSMCNSVGMRCAYDMADVFCPADVMTQPQSMYECKPFVLPVASREVWEGGACGYGKFPGAGQSPCNQGESVSTCVPVADGCVSVQGGSEPVGEGPSDASEVRLESEPGQEEPRNQGNVSLGQPGVAGQSDVLVEELVAGEVCGIEPAQAEIELCGEAQCAQAGNLAGGSSRGAVKEAVSVASCMPKISQGCWNKGEAVSGCLAVCGEEFLPLSKEGAPQPVKAESSVVVPELGLDMAKAQEGGGPRFVSAGERDEVTQVESVSVLPEPQRSDSGDPDIVPDAAVLLAEGGATLWEQGDPLARAQGENEGVLTLVPNDGVDVYSHLESCTGSEDASDPVSCGSVCVPERGLSMNPPEGPEMIQGVRELQEELVVAQQGKAAAEPGKGELLLKGAHREESPGSACSKQFAVTERGDDAWLGEGIQEKALPVKGSSFLCEALVLVPDRRDLSVNSDSTDLGLGKPSVDGVGEVSEGLRVVPDEAGTARELEQAVNPVTVGDQLAGKSVCVGQDCSQVNEESGKLVSQIQEKGWVDKYAEQNSCVVTLPRMQEMAVTLPSLDTVDTHNQSGKWISGSMWKQRLERDRGETWESTAYCCYPTEWGKGENSRAIVSQGVTPSQPFVLVRPEVSGLEPRGQGGGSGLALTKKICRLNLKGKNCNGVEPKKGHDGECQYTPNIGLFLLLMLIRVTNVLLLQRIVTVYSVHELMKIPCILSGDVPNDRRYVRGHCDVAISWLTLVTGFGTSYRTKRVPARRSCVRRETEAHHHFDGGGL